MKYFPAAAHCVCAFFSLQIEALKKALADNRSKAEAAIKQRGTLSVLSLPTLQVFMCSHLSAQLAQWLSIARVLLYATMVNNDNACLSCP
jgi:hypothetical protein